jgi:predicted MPP superfamily phosphohydrolase
MKSGIGGIGELTGLNVVLYHIPKMKPKTLKECGAFLMLAGHTRGGRCFQYRYFHILRISVIKGCIHLIMH